MNIARALQDYFGVLAWVEDYFEPAHVPTPLEREIEARRAADVKEFLGEVTS